MLKENKKVAIIGCGNVGSTVAYTLYCKNICDLILVNHNNVRSISNVLDINDCTVERNHCTISSGNYNDIKDCDVVINCAGNSFLLRGGSRYSEFENSERIARDIIHNINAIGFNGIFINVMNPCDEITYIFGQLNLDKNKIIGTGTLLETLRLRRIVFDKYSWITNSYIVGNHGVNNELIRKDKLLGLTDNEIQQLLNEVRDRIWNIYAGKGFTNFGISHAILLILLTVFGNMDKELCIDTLLSDTYNIKDTCISVPCILNSSGIKEVRKYDEVQGALNKLKL